MYVRSIEGNEYAVQATVTNDNEVNGNQSLTGDIEYNKVNALFLSGLDTLWEIYDHDDVGYKIINLNKKGNGNKLQVSFTAIPLFFDYMDTHSMMDDDGNHYRYDGSMTAFNAFNKVFADTPFTFVIVDQLTAVEWENFGGGESRLETFKRCLERYECEFRIVGSTVYLENQIGRDTSIQYRHKLNASNITQEIDASTYYTAIRGYGHFGEGTSEDSTEEDYRNARLIRDYVSPLAKILGKRYSPPFMDGRVKVKAEMNRKLKKEVDESLKVSVSADIVNLSQQGYPIDNSQAGDRVFLIDERIGFDEEVRIVSQSITRDWTGKVIDANVTFGNEGLGKRHQSQLNTAVKNITDIFEGRKQLPLSHLDKRVQEISNIINGNTDSIFKYTPNGIIGWNGDDPNYMTRYVGDAIGFSKDGGKTYGTAMSAELGIVADYITTGTLRAIIVDGVEIYGSYIEGGTFFTGDDTEYTEISDAKLVARGNFKRTWLGQTTNHDVRMFLENGYLRFRNDSLKRSLYISEFGMSTYVDGEGSDEGENSSMGSSGTIQWWDETYSVNSRGLTMNSYAGKPVISSDVNHVVIHPFRERSSKLFYFTKSEDGHDGYIYLSTLDGGDTSSGKRGGLRFVNDTNGIIQIVDSNNTTGGNTSIEAGNGTFNTIRRRPGTNYLNLQNENYMKLGLDGDNEPRIASNVIYRRTYSSSANVHITPEDTLGRSTSASKYKNAIERQFENEDDQLKHSKNILKLNPESWYDKYECDLYAKELEEGRRLSVENFEIKRHVGLIAEHVEEAGLSEHVIYNSDGELEEIAYDRLWIHLIPIIKNQEKRIEELEKNQKDVS